MGCRWQFVVLPALCMYHVLLMASGFVMRGRVKNGLVRKTNSGGQSVQALKIIHDKERRRSRRPPAFSLSTRVMVPPAASTPLSSTADASTGAVIEHVSNDADVRDFSFRHSSTVFIEMTDMYGIVYHANYVTYALRAIERTFGAQAARVHQLQDMRYRTAATLGETAIVSGNLVAYDEDSGRSSWRFEITAEDPSRVFVSAKVSLSWPSTGGTLPSGLDASILGEDRSREEIATDLSQPLPTAFENTPKTLDVVVWSDDLDMEGGELKVGAVLNYFERIRTLSLGRDLDTGELGLVRLHREGVSIVVTNIADLRINSKGVKAGDTLKVRVGAQLTRGNRLMTMYQTLWTQEGRLVAHAEITLFCMDNETRKFRSMPPWVQEVVSVPLATTAD